MELKDVLSFSGAFNEKYKDESEQLPYHINVIDELRANENAHSRILIKLLKFNKNKIDYPILKSFLEFLSSQSDCFRFDTSKIEIPRMTSEKHRIDALVVEKGKYGIIIENKIHGAEDQFKQISNYVNKVAKQALKVHQIYVIYLTKYGGTPNHNSFSKKQIQEYSEGKRYIEASYYTHVLPWLESKEFLSLCNNERMLRSSIEQYTDHLKGMFNQRMEQSVMDEKLINEIECKLDILDKTCFDKKEVLRKTLSEFDKTRGYINKALYKNYFKLWQENIEADYCNYDYYEKVKDAVYPKTGIKLKFKGIEFGVLIEYNTKRSLVCYGINGSEFGDKKLENEISNLIENLKHKHKLDQKSDKWYRYRILEPEKLYEEYKKLLNEVFIFIENNSLA